VTGEEDKMADAGEDKITQKTTNNPTTSGKKPKATTNARKANAAAPKAVRK
jgi:hypothetical protein